MKSMWTDGKPAPVKRGTLHRSGRESFIILCLLLVSVPGLSSATPSRADINERFTMDEFRDEAISSNLELMNKRNDVELSGIEVKKARAQRLPTIDSTLSYTLMGNPQDPVYIYTEDLAGLLPEIQQSGGGLDRIKVMDGGEPGYFKFELELQQPLFTWGRLAGYEKIMRIKADIDQLEVSDYLDELAANVEGLYYSFYVLNGMETTLNGQIDMMEVLYRITEENYQKGFIELGDFLTVSGNQLELKEAKAEILFQKEKVLFMLQELIADPTFTPERLDFNGIDLDMNLFPVPSVSEAVARGLSGNQQLEQLVKAAYIKEQELALAEKSGIFRPDLALQVGFSYNGSRVPLLEKDWLRQDDFDLNITLAGTTSLWDSGLSATEKRIKKAELEAFQVQQEQARQKIHMQITQTISGLEFSRSKIETLEVRRQLISEETELAGNRYEQGDISEAEYVKQQIQLNQHELKIFSEWQNFLNGYSQLGYLLGN